MRPFSVALATPIHRALIEHLVRGDGDEDLTFLVWKPSVGQERDTAVICDVVWPGDGDRHVHGNVSFESRYFLRACAAAERAGGGLALIHSHPGGTGWQGLSRDDHAAESGHAAQAVALTGQPLLGLTLAGASRTYSARSWHKTAPRIWEAQWALSVRVVGDHMLVSLPEGREQFTTKYQKRTIDAWGPQAQQVIGSLRVGVVGAGSVGSQIVEGLARTGFGNLVVMDYDAVENHNLDRILNATTAHADAGELKARVAADAALAHGTHPTMRASWTDQSAVEANGIAVLKDCDLIFSCVDRPAGRASLNALAYAHLIPVIDGGVMVTPGRRFMRGAEWRAHVAAPGRRCLECLGQYDPGLVQADRDGLLDEPTYLSELPPGHVLNRNQNVFAFSAAAAAEQVLAALRMLVAPAGVADVGAQTFHFATGTVDRDTEPCNPGCLYQSATATATADGGGRPAGHRHVPAEKARASRLALSFSSDKGTIDDVPPPAQG